MMEAQDSGAIGSGTSGPDRARELREAVRERYARAARRWASESGGGNCCGPEPTGDPITRDLYERDEVAGLPDSAVQASLGCGNPTMLAELRPGEVVLDLGSGGGLDVLLSARRVGPTGKAYGLDMTDEMLELGRENARVAGVANVEFLKGYMEEIPLPDGAVDVVISNCVVNLASDKRSVFREIFRVLRPGGRLAVADVVVQGELPPELRRDLELWSGCLAGALSEEGYRSELGAAGFERIDLEVLRVHDPAELSAAEDGCGCGSSRERLASAPEGRFCSAFVRARKPR